MVEFDRRRGIILALSVALTSNREVFAQTSDELSGSLANAFRLQDFATFKAATDKDYAQFVTDHFFLRKSTVYLTARSRLFDNTERAIGYLNSLIGSSAPGVPSSYFSEASIKIQIQQVLFIASTGVPLIPNPQDILPIGIPAADPASPKSSDTDFGVILDIALQTMGIFEGKSLADELLKDKEVLSALHELAPSVADKNWKTALALAEKIFEIIVTSSVTKAIIERAGKRIAFRLSLRCVPIVGWVYVVASFVVALKANYHRFSFA